MLADIISKKFLDKQQSPSCTLSKLGWYIEAFRNERIECTNLLHYFVMKFALVLINTVHMSVAVEKEERVRISEGHWNSSKSPYDDSCS